MFAIAFDLVVTDTLENHPKGISVIVSRLFAKLLFICA